MVYAAELFGRLLRTQWTGENAAQLLAEELYSMGTSWASGQQPLVIDSPVVLRQSGDWPALSIVRTGPDAAWQPTQLVDQPPGGLYGPMPTFTPGPYSFSTNPNYPEGYQPAGPSYYGGTDQGGGGVNIGGLGDTTINLPPLPPFPPSPSLPPLYQPGLYTEPTPIFKPDGGPVGPPIGGTGGGGGGGGIVGKVTAGSGRTYTIDAYLDTAGDPPPDGVATSVTATALGLSDDDKLDVGSWWTLSKYGDSYVFAPQKFMSGAA